MESEGISVTFYTHFDTLFVKDVEPHSYSLTVLGVKY